MECYEEPLGYELNVAMSHAFMRSMYLIYPPKTILEYVPLTVVRNIGIADRYVLQMDESRLQSKENFVD